MAKFHVGQRVRIIGFNPMSDPIVGVETVITSGPDFDSLGRIGYRTAASDAEGDISGILADQLAPLTDPGAEKFLESIKRLGREPINDAPAIPVKVTR